MAGKYSGVSSQSLQVNVLAIYTYLTVWLKTYIAFLWLKLKRFLQGANKVRHFFCSCIT